MTDHPPTQGLTVKALIEKLLHMDFKLLVWIEAPTDDTVRPALIAEVQMVGEGTGEKAVVIA